MLEIKKHPQNRLDNYSKIFLQIGLSLALFIVYTILEFKTYEKITVTSNVAEVTMVMEMTEDIPIVKMQKIQATQTATAPLPTIEDIKIVEDDIEIPETILESTETDENEAITDALITTGDIVEVAESEEIIEDIPFILIEDVPVYPGCKGNNKELKECFRKSITEFVGARFNVNLAVDLGLNPGKKKLFVVFTISNTGKVIKVQVRGPHPVLEEEITKIISSLPKMIPGKQRGTPVNVSYNIPITFIVME